MVCQRQVGCWCISLANTPLIVATALVYTVQATLLDHLLIEYRGGFTRPDTFPGCSTNCTNPSCSSDQSRPNVWYVVIFFDFVPFITMALSFLLNAKSFQRREQFAQPMVDEPWHKYVTKVPLSPITWGIYSSYVAVKVAIIFHSGIASCLSGENLYGPGLLKTVIALSALIFILYVWGHYSPAAEVETNHFVNTMMTGVALDILDSVNFLNILLTKADYLEPSSPFSKVVLTISCLNLIRPVFSFLVLFMLHVKQQGLFWVKVANTLIYILLVDLPFMGLRLVSWRAYQSDVSVFLFKNALMVFLGGKQLLDLWHERKDSKHSQMLPTEIEMETRGAQEVAMGAGGHQERELESRGSRLGGFH